jgi:hypothetical protein
MPLLVSAGRPLRIGFIRDTGAFDGAGCSLWLAGDRTGSEKRYIFFSDLENQAVMNIDGRDVHLAPTGPSERPSESKLGGHARSSYQAGGLRVVVRYTVTGVCAPADESCEVTKYRATLTVTRGTAKRMVAAHGECGT